MSHDNLIVCALLLWCWWTNDVNGLAVPRTLLDLFRTHKSRRSTVQTRGRVHCGDMYPDVEAPVPSEQLHDHWVTVDGLRLYARISRAVPDPAALSVILIHGAFVSSRYMVPVASRLAPHYNVYAPDLPGYGRSARPAHMPSVAGFSDILVQWMEAAGLTRAAFVANSFGCQIVADLAVRYPERVAKAILVGPTVDPAHHTLLQQGVRLLLDGTREPLRFLLLLGGDCLKIGPREGVQLVRAVLSDRIEENLPRMTVPTLVVRGEHDPLVPPRWGEEATRLLPSARLAVITGVAHVAHYDAPDRFVSLARPFLDAP